MSTPYRSRKPQPDIEQLALLARAKREGLLRANRHRLRREDLEDCFGQATLELLAGLRRGHRFADRRHLANVLEQRFLSRVADRQRALHGRSPQLTVLEQAVSLEALTRDSEPADPRADVHALVERRTELRRICASLPGLTADQRLVLGAQAIFGIERGDFCRWQGWSHDKYSKVAVRARARLRAHLADDSPATPVPTRPSGSPMRPPAAPGQADVVSESGRLSHSGSGGRNKR